jgi:hypothetical protein
MQGAEYVFHVASPFQACLLLRDDPTESKLRYRGWAISLMCRIFSGFCCMLGAESSCWPANQYRFIQAAQVHVDDAESQLLRPAVEGTANVLRAAAAATSTVKRVVLTSSVAGVWGVFET